MPFTDVHLTDAFWAPRLETNRTVTIPHIFKQSEETGRVKNFELAEAALAGATDGKYCTRFPFDDSDVYKIIEAASYALATHADPELEKYVDGLIAKIAAAQEPDGYLYAARTIGGPPPQPWLGKERWSHLYMSHELYNVGHLYEAAAAHYQATGKKNLLAVAVKSADLVAREFGPGKRTNPARPRGDRDRPGQALPRHRARGSTSTWPSSSSTPAARPKAASPTSDPARARNSSSTANTPRTTSPSSSRPRPSGTPSGPATSTPARPTSPP